MAALADAPVPHVAVPSAHPTAPARHVGARLLPVHVTAPLARRVGARLPLVHARPALHDAARGKMIAI